MMEETGMKAQVIEEIRALAGEYGVEKVILFGSRARGNYKRASDIDLAVSGGDILRFALAVDEETSTPLRFDIINLDGRPSTTTSTILTQMAMRLPAGRRLSGNGTILSPELDTH